MTYVRTSFETVNATLRRPRDMPTTNNRNSTLVAGSGTAALATAPWTPTMK